MVRRAVEDAAARAAAGAATGAWRHVTRQRAPDPRVDERRAWRGHWRALLRRLLAPEGGSAWGRRRRALARRPWILVARVPEVDGEAGGAAGRWVPDGEPLVLAGAVLVPVAWPSIGDDAVLGDPRAHPALAALRRCVSRPPSLVVVLRLPMALLAADAGGTRAGVARTVRQALRGLREAVGVHCPLHVVVDDVHRLPGFERFLRLTPRARRDQPWGWVEDASAGASTGFDAWWPRLEADAMARFHACTDADAARARRQRVDLFALPGDVRAWRAGWRDWRERLLDPAGEDEAPWLRGAWLTGRSASVVDAVAAGAADAPLDPGHPFLGELLATGWPAEARLARPSAAWRRRRDRCRRSWRGAFAVLALAACAGRGMAWWHEAACVRGLERQVQDLAASSSSTLRASSLLAALDGLARGGDGSPASSGSLAEGWRTQGAARSVRRAALAARGRLAGEAWWPRLQARLAARLVDRPRPGEPGHPGEPEDDRYEALRVQRMLHEPMHYDVGEVAAWWRADRSGNTAGPAGDELDAVVVQHLLEAGPPVALAEVPAPVVAQAREALRGRPLAEAVRARWHREEAIGATASSPFRISEAAGPDAALVFRRTSGAPLSAPLPGGCDAASRQRLARRAPVLARALADEAGWVLGEASPGTDRPGRVRAAARAARRAQAARASHEWQALLDDLRLGPSPPATGQDFEDLARRLSQPDSPLQRLVVAIAREWVGMPDAALAAGSPTPVEDDVADGEAPRWRRWADDPAQASSPLARLREAFREAATQWRPPGRDGEAGPGSPASRAAGEQLRQAVADAPTPVRHWIEDLVARWEASGRVRSARAWQSAADEDVGGWCRQAIAGRYPFVAGGRDEVPLADLAALFAPGGRFDQFVAGHAGVRDAPDGSAATVPDRLRATLAGAARVRDAFFGAARASSVAPGPAAWPPLSASLRLVSLAPAGATVRLTASGRTTTFGSPDDPPLRWTWPDGAPSALTLELAPPPAEGRPPATVVAVTGPWALFRLLDAGHVRPVAPGRPAERLAFAFAASGVQAAFEWQADSVRHPWGLEALRAFRCPAAAR